MRGDRRMRTVREKAEEDGSRKVVSVNMSDVSVFVAMPTTRDLPPQTVLSLLDTQSRLGKIGIPFVMLLEIGVSDIMLARSICVHRFLQDKANRLFWVDSDMQWEPDSFLRMLALSTKTDVVCGSYPMKREPLDFLSGTPGAVTLNDYGCIPFTSGGLGFTVVN